MPLLSCECSKNIIRTHFLDLSLCFPLLDLYGQEATGRQGKLPTRFILNLYIAPDLLDEAGLQGPPVRTGPGTDWFFSRQEVLQEYEKGE